MSTHRFKTDFRKRYPVCFELLPNLENIIGEEAALSEVLDRHPEWCRRHAFLVDLARIEEARHLVLTSPSSLPE
ncbi:MAG: hypothetical protein WAL93_03275, partial [Desulfobacterales bacterium]